MYHVYYDTLCPFCQRTRRTLARLDWRGRLQFRDLHDRGVMEADVPGVSYQRALAEMIVRAPGGKVYGGFDALRELAWVLPPLWLVAPLLYLPGAAWVGRRLYRVIARNRYRLVACENDICSLHLRALSQPDLPEAEIRRLVTLARGTTPNPEAAEPATMP